MDGCRLYTRVSLWALRVEKRYDAAMHTPDRHLPRDLLSGMRLQPMDHFFLAYERGPMPVEILVFERFSTDL
jgi:hypothetical protein